MANRPSKGEFSTLARQVTNICGLSRSGELVRALDELRLHGEHVTRLIGQLSDYLTTERLKQTPAVRAATGGMRFQFCRYLDEKNVKCGAPAVDGDNGRCERHAGMGVARPRRHLAVRP
jgi:hypothetical protein